MTTRSTIDLMPRLGEARVLLHPPTLAWWTDALGAIHALLSGRRWADAYLVEPIRGDFDGVAARLVKQDGSVRHALLGENMQLCECVGFQRTGACRHVYTLEVLAAAGLLPRRTPSPHAALTAGAAPADQGAPAGGVQPGHRGHERRG